MNRQQHAVGRISTRSRSKNNNKRSHVLFLALCFCLVRSLLWTNSYDDSFVGPPPNNKNNPNKSSNSSDETTATSGIHNKRIISAAAAQPASLINHHHHHNHDEADDVLVYHLPPNYYTKKQPLRHLDEIDPAILQVGSSNNNKNSYYYYPIDLVHRKGWMHAGGWMHVLDIQHKLLLLRRGPHLVTSPNTWSLVGEHAYRNETPLETARRGLVEELGLPIQQQQHQHEQQSSSSSTPSLTFTIQNLTEQPVLYLREYGPILLQLGNNNNKNVGRRIDCQITYMWYVQLNQPHFNVTLQLDDEVADHTWMELDQVREWVNSSNSSNNNKNDFGCPETQALILKGIELLLQVIQQQQQ